MIKKLYVWVCNSRICANLFVYIWFIILYFLSSFPIQAYIRSYMKNRRAWPLNFFECAAKLQRPSLSFCPSMCSAKFQWILFAYVILLLKHYDVFPWLTLRNICRNSFNVRFFCLVGCTRSHLDAHVKAWYNEYLSQHCFSRQYALFRF